MGESMKKMVRNHIKSHEQKSVAFLAIDQTEGPRKYCSVLQVHP